MCNLWARPRISLYSEYMYPHPLWRLDGVGPKLEDLSAELQISVNDWDALFQEFFWPGGWKDENAREQYSRRAPDLWRQTQTEVGLAYRVQVDLWPCGRGAMVAPTPVTLRSERARGLLESLGGSELSGEVLGVLNDWDALFQENHVAGFEWSDRDACAEYRRRIPEVMACLQANVGMEFDVRVDGWPLPDPPRCGEFPGWPGVFEQPCS